MNIKYNEKKFLEDLLTLKKLHETKLKDEKFENFTNEN